MCLAIPGEVLELEEDHALVDYGGAKSKVNISFVEDVNVGDYVIVHVGYAIQKMSKKEAQESIEMINQVLGD